MKHHPPQPPQKPASGAGAAFAITLLIGSSVVAGMLFQFWRATPVRGDRQIIERFEALDHQLGRLKVDLGAIKDLANVPPKAACCCKPPAEPVKPEPAKPAPLPRHCGCGSVVQACPCQNGCECRDWCQCGVCPGK